MQLFTGIVEGTAKVKSMAHSRRGAEISLILQLGKTLGKGLRVGDSVSVSGACLTVTKLYSSGSAEFQLVAETVRRTCLGDLRPGDQVNIERSLRVGDRLEGHFVLGHVDTTGTIDQVTKAPSETTMWIKLDGHDAWDSVPIVSKGSITIDGISLTVVDTDIRHNRFSVSLIPHTLKVTSFGKKQRGSSVNVEFDIIGKYVGNQFSDQLQSVFAKGRKL